MQVTIEAIEQLAKAVNNPAWNGSSRRLNEEKKAKLREIAHPRFEEAYNLTTQTGTVASAVDHPQRERRRRCRRGRRRFGRELDSLLPEENRGRHRPPTDFVRAGKNRRRKNDEVRDISIRVGVLPRVHGSALFTRGETQALVAATLGADRDDQKIDGLERRAV